MKKSDFKEIKNKGFHKKWWEEKAAGNCKGIGVEKALELCMKSYITRDGLPAGVTDRKQAETAAKAYDGLVKQLNNEKSKCGKFQAETKEAIVKHFLPQILAGRAQLQPFLLAAADEKHQAQMKDLEVERAAERAAKKKEADEKKALGLDVRDQKSIGSGGSSDPIIKAIAYSYNISGHAKTLYYNIGGFVSDYDDLIERLDKAPAADNPKSLLKEIKISWGEIIARTKKEEKKLDVIKSQMNKLKPAKSYKDSAKAEVEKYQQHVESAAKAIKVGDETLEKVRKKRDQFAKALKETAASVL